MKYGGQKEWDAGRELILGKWKPDTKYKQLRMAIQAARSGEFFPANMHVDLILEILEIDPDSIGKQPGD